MKILFIAGTFPQLTFIFRTVVAVAEQGHEVLVMAREAGEWKQFAEELPLPSSLTVRYLTLKRGQVVLLSYFQFIGELVGKFIRMPTAVWKLARMCYQRPETRKHPIRNFLRHLPFLGVQADVIQFEFLMKQKIYPLVAELVSAPTIVSCRGADIHMLGVRSNPIRDDHLQILQSASLVHCVSDEMAEAVTQVSGRTEGLWVNRPALRIDKIIPKQNYESSAVPTIVSVGRLHWKKGFDYLLVALRRIKNSGIPFKAQIIGDGVMRQHLQAAVEDLGLETEVELVGRLKPDAVFEYLKNADIYVLSSHEEGISNAVLEAMAVGLPVVATCAGGMEEAVRDGVDGYVIPVRDIPAMVEKLAVLLADPRLRERMGRSARERVEAEFTLERQAKVFSQMYVAAHRQSLTAAPTT